MLEPWWFFRYKVKVGVLCATAVGEWLLSLLLESWIELGDDDEYEEVDEYGEYVWF